MSWGEESSHSCSLLFRENVVPLGGHQLSCAERFVSRPFGLSSEDISESQYGSGNPSSAFYYHSRQQSSLGARPNVGIDEDLLSRGQQLSVICVPRSPHGSETYHGVHGSVCCLSLMTSVLSKTREQHHLGANEAALMSCNCCTT